MKLWERTRSNHGLEHATIALLIQRMAVMGILAGNATPGSFFIYGNVSTEEVERCAAEALERLGSGQEELAVSPFCGTNLVVGAALASAGAIAALHLAGRNPGGWTRAFTNALVGLVLARPLGRLVQRRYTTSADVAGMSVSGVSRWQLGSLTIHRVSTAFSSSEP